MPLAWLGLGLGRGGAAIRWATTRSCQASREPIVQGLPGEYSRRWRLGRHPVSSRCCEGRTAGAGAQALPVPRAPAETATRTLQPSSRTAHDPPAATAPRILPAALQVRRARAPRCSDRDKPFSGADKTAALGSSDQGIAPHILERAIGASSFVVLAAPRRPSHANPVGRPITGASVPSRINEGLCEVDRMRVDPLPVRRDLTFHPAQQPPSVCAARSSATRAAVWARIGRRIMNGLPRGLRQCASVCAQAERLQASTANHKPCHKTTSLPIQRARSRFACAVEAASAVKAARVRR